MWTAGDMVVQVAPDAGQIVRDRDPHRP